jgi:hexosaminidase
MRFKYLPLYCFLLITTSFACNNAQQKQQESSGNGQSKVASFEYLIPKPVSASDSAGAFVLAESSGIFIENDSSTELLKIGQYLASKLRPATGFSLPVAVSANEKKGGHIYLSLGASDGNTGEEGYQLKITTDYFSLKANKPAGLFRGIQTIRQLFSPSIESSTLQKSDWQVGTGLITDYPEYALRGSMLDVARHFFGVEEVKRYIDLMAFYKMNLMHLHLSDDQGWRIEIKSWPKLTTYGGSTEVGGGKGGFYTQEQYKEIVEYAADRYITIVPEIDMPGHTNAAMASYPELNCNPKDKNPKLYTGTNVGFSTLCTKSEKVYQFVDDVIRELAAITPGAYIHIGGDESHVTPKNEYIQFINRAQAIVTKYGKQVMGWDEIALSTLQPNTIAQYWSDSANSVNAVKQGAKILMSPAGKTYLDMQYDSTTKWGLHWAAYIEVDAGYNWDPTTLVKGIARENIIGIEAPLWSETVAAMDEVEYMVFPRLPGYAEIGWSPPIGRTWEEYKIRLGKHGSRMKAMNINFYKSAKVPWVD